MSDINSVISDILNDPESMARVKSMAENLLKENEEEKTGDIANTDEIKTVMNIVSRLKTKSDDKKTALLLALKPNLSPEKQAKIDSAIKLLRLIEILPTLKESGLLDLF